MGSGFGFTFQDGWWDGCVCVRVGDVGMVWVWGGVGERREAKGMIGEGEAWRVVSDGSMPDSAYAVGLYFASYSASTRKTTYRYYC